MRPLLDFLPDILMAAEPPGTRRPWHGQGALPLSVRISERLGDMLITASELQADLGSPEAGPLREIASEVDEVGARIETLLKQLAA